MGKRILPLYWMLFPTLSLLLFPIVSLIFTDPHKPSVWKFAMDVAYQVFTPRNGKKIIFPHFFFCNYINVAKGIFWDVLLIITCGRLPEWVLIFFFNILSIIRVIQSFIRVREMKNFYN